MVVEKEKEKNIFLHLFFLLVTGLVILGISIYLKKMLKTGSRSYLHDCYPRKLLLNTSVFV